MIRGALALALLLPAVARAERSFLGGRVVEIPSRASYLTLGDWDGDGLLDAAVVGFEDRVHVLRGTSGSLFKSSASHAVGRNPIYVAHADFDGSGRPDLLVVNGGGRSISVLLGAGDGTFLEARDTSVDFQVLQAGLGDFDDDARTDVVLTQVTSTSSGSLRVLLGEGNGRFNEAPQVDTGDNPHSVVVDDFDGDGLRDVAVARTRGISFIASRGNGTFLPRKETSLEAWNLNPRALVGGDFDRDGKPDLFGFGDLQSLVFLRNAGRGSFDASAIQNVGEILTYTPALGAVDFTGDGHLDIFAGSGRTEAPGIRIHAGRGDGTFADRRDIFLGIALGPAVLQDIDADGHADLVGGRSDAADLAIFEGTGPGEIARPFDIPLPAAPRDLVPLDLGGNGALDLAALESSAVHLIRSGDPGAPGTVSLQGSALQAGAAADLDGDGLDDLAVSDIVSPRVALLFLDRAGSAARTSGVPVGGTPGRIAAADFDVDGTLDLVVSDAASTEALVILAPGTSATPGRLSLAVGPVQSAVCASDLDGDGAEDVAVASRSGISVFFGSSTRPLERSLFLEAGANAPALAAPDLDGDGAAELLAAVGNEVLLFEEFSGGTKPAPRTTPLGFSPRAIEILGPALPGGSWKLILAGRNTLAEMEVLPGGALSPPETYPFGYLVRAMALSDIDGDSKPDCATAGLEKGISVLRGLSAGSPEPFRRGEVDGDGALLLTDAIRILDRLFLGASPLPCPDAADADDDGMLGLTDAVSILLHLFQGGSPPPDPGPTNCGADPTEDDLGACAPGCGGR